MRSIIVRISKPYRAFDGLTGLKTLNFHAKNIPSINSLTGSGLPIENLDLTGVETIASGVLSYLYQLKQVTVGWQTPLVLTFNPFYGIDTHNVTLNVPEGTEDAYRAAYVWKDFYIVVNLPTGIPGLNAETGAYLYDGRLYINSPVAETIQVYSVNGVLLHNFRKPAGSADYIISKASGAVLIVKGGSGWVKKVIR